MVAFGGPIVHTRTANLRDGCAAFPRPPRNCPLVHVAERAGTWAARVAARSTRARRLGRARWTLCRDSEDRELGFEFRGVAFGARGFFFAVEESLELVMAFLADIFVNRHLATPYLF